MRREGGWRRRLRPGAEAGAGAGAGPLGGIGRKCRYTGPMAEPPELGSKPPECSPQTARTNCPVCGRDISAEILFSSGRIFFPIYCNNCGAKLRLSLCRRFLAFLTAVLISPVIATLLASVSLPLAQILFPFLGIGSYLICHFQFARVLIESYPPNPPMVHSNSASTAESADPSEAADQPLNSRAQEEKQEIRDEPPPRS